MSDHASELSPVETSEHMPDPMSEQRKDSMVSESMSEPMPDDMPEHNMSEHMSEHMQDECQNTRVESLRCHGQCSICRLSVGQKHSGFLMLVR